jgi:trehalose 6-phosphate phosphatase
MAGSKDGKGAGRGSGKAPARDLAVLRAFMDRATLLAFDLDGTIAPIMEDPMAARVPVSLRRALVRLGRLAPVAVITGRGCADARGRLGFEPRYLVGNHGAEGLPAQDGREDSWNGLCRVWVRQLLARLPAGMGGLFLEDKGTSLSVHYRGAHDRDAADREVLAVATALSPTPRLIPGHCVVNILPPDAPDKGDAVAVLMHDSGCARAVFVGDDETDETVFRRTDLRVLGIRVGPCVSTAARLRLPAQDDVARLVDELIALLSA